VTFAAGTTINGLTVGRGAGAISTNTAVGASALNANTSGLQNTAIGSGALALNTSGNYGVAVGFDALAANTTGADNSAFGRRALYNNTTGSDNQAVGFNALFTNTTGANNTAIGSNALTSNTTASNNTAVGYQAGYTQTTATNNTIMGFQAGYGLTTGSRNTFVGAYNGSNGSGRQITTGSANTILGGYDGNQGGLNITTASNYIVLSDGDGNPRLYYHGTDATWKSQPIYNFTSANTANMYIGSGYDIGRVTSALKYKQDIRDLENIDIGLFRAVRYKSKCANDDQTKDYFGVIADEVADAGIEELVIRNADGEVESFAYDRLTVVLLKELQRLKAEVAALKGQS
jgi:hypothetical protein